MRNWTLPKMQDELGDLDSRWCHMGPHAKVHCFVSWNGLIVRNKWTFFVKWFIIANIETYMLTNATMWWNQLNSSPKVDENSWEVEQNHKDDGGALLRRICVTCFHEFFNQLPLVCRSIVFCEMIHYIVRNKWTCFVKWFSIANIESYMLTHASMWWNKLNSRPKVDEKSWE